LNKYPSPTAICISASGGFLSTKVAVARFGWIAQSLVIPSNLRVHCLNVSQE